MYRKEADYGMEQIADYIISENMIISDAIRAIDKNGQGIAFVCADGKLKAVVSDGDIRRYALKNGKFERPVSELANYSPRVIKNGAVQEKDIREYLFKNRITAVPVVDEENRILRIYFKNRKKIENKRELKIPLVIMAGGKGTRLYPYTQILPKPLIPIGDKTITEHILEHFAEFGCRDVTMIVNYKKKFIETYFSEEDRQDIRFVEEEEFYGTGGGLKLLSGMKQTFFMTNCDILVESDYAEIVAKHKREDNIITIVCAKKRVEIPYGTIEKDHTGRFAGMKEKPVFSFLVNTGFYVIEPRFLDRIPDKTFIHITDVIEQCVKTGENVGIYEVEEGAWMDMGQMDELEKMRERLEENSNNTLR